MKIRKPRITIGKKGIRLTNVGMSIGGKKTRVNISRMGVSTTVGTKGATYNTRRGFSFSPFTWLTSIFKRKRR